jgi:hypothetical protein
MFLSFKIPRIRGAGMYQFVFDSGFLKGLIGEVVVEGTKNANYPCFISIDIKWSGPPSPFPNFVFKYFSKFLLKRSIYRLWEKSGHHFKNDNFY